MARAACASLLTGPAVANWRSYVTELPPAHEQAAPAAADHDINSIWTLWNNGNLFSLSVQELGMFLTKQRRAFPPAAKRAALVRLVEEFMQEREDQMKGKPKPEAPAAREESPEVGAWDKPAVSNAAPEILLDLQQGGFYENGSATMAPRAFQLLVDKAAQDLVVARVNTTAFPGFPSSLECYTLCPADAEQATLARYNKSLQWCVMNMKNLNMTGEIFVEFGKLLLMRSVLKKKSSIVPAWTLQQRLQSGSNPMHWVSCASAQSTPAVEAFLATHGFIPSPRGPLTYDAIVRRKDGALSLSLDENAHVKQVNRPWEYLQRSNVTKDQGVDIRFLVRGRVATAPGSERQFAGPLADVKSDPVVSKVPPSVGEITYLSENAVRTWTKQSRSGVLISVTETKREPLMISGDEEQGFRLEYNLKASVSEPKTDITTLSIEMYKLAKTFGALLDAAFVEEFKTTTAPLNAKYWNAAAGAATTQAAE